MWFEQCRGGRTWLSIYESVLLKHSPELGLGEKKIKDYYQRLFNIRLHTNSL